VLPAAAWLAALPAWAESPATSAPAGQAEVETADVLGSRLVVEREASALGCAGASAIAERVTPLATRTRGAAPLRLVVRVWSEDGGFSAEIVAEGEKHGMRRLSAPGPG
jgi:hypothetical protein